MRVCGEKRKTLDMPTTILEVNNLIKRFNGVTAVDDISFRVENGQAVGLLGPNGAGKTTTIHILLDITTATSGTISYFGKAFPAHRQWCLQRINFASAYNTLQDRISVWENLLVFAGLYGVAKPKPKIMELVEYFEIGDCLNVRFRNLSTGQKTRVILVKALLNDPTLILMDEPTASLDPDIADKTLTLIENLKKTRALTLLFTSHNMDEVTRICDRVIFLDHGKIVAEDSPLGLTKRITTAHLKLTFDADTALVERYLTARRQTYRLVSSTVVGITTTEALVPELIFGLSKSGVWITDIEVKKPTLEDVFLQIARKTVAR